jgi:hypothetical protein
MRILIEDPTGPSYFNGLEWTGEVDEAKDFGTVAAAETYCDGQHLNGVLIVVKFKNAENDIRYSPTRRNALLVSKPPTTRIKSLS